MESSPAHVGRIVTITGAGAVARLFKNGPAEDPDKSTLTIGRLVGVSSDSALIVGIVVRMSVSPPDPNEDSAGDLIAEIDFMGEIRRHGTDQAFFQRGVSSYPAIGNKIIRVQTDDIGIIHRIEKGETIEVGHLRLDASVPATIITAILTRRS